MENKQYFTTNELAKILGISRVAVFNKIKNNQIKAEKIGRNYIIRKDEVDELIGNVLSEKLTNKIKQEINNGVTKVIKEYGEVLQRLSKE